MQTSVPVMDKLTQRLVLLVLYFILIVAATYWKLSDDMAGTTMLGVWYSRRPA